MKTITQIYCFLRHSLDKSEGVRFVVSLLVNGLIIYTAWNVVLYIIISFLPASHYFHYYSVEPTKWEYAIGEKITFQSVFEWKSSQVVEWNDILRCPPIDYFSNHKSGAIVQKKNSTSYWVYAWQIPTEPSECILEAQITSTVKYGIKKTQKILSQPFLIK